MTGQRWVRRWVAAVDAAADCTGLWAVAATAVAAATVEATLMQLATLPAEHRPVELIDDPAAYAVTTAPLILMAAAGYRWFLLPLAEVVWLLAAHFHRRKHERKL